MENNYWKDDIAIVASEEEKLEILKYEVWMFNETCRLIKGANYNLFEGNLLFESLAIHARILIVFF